MRRIICFSAIVTSNKNIVGNCFVAYHYEKVFSDYWNVCYVNSVLYLKDNERLLNSEFWNETNANNWQSVKDGQRLVQQTLNSINNENITYEFILKDEKYILENTSKQIYILRDYVNRIQYLQIQENGQNTEHTESINMGFKESEDKYL